MCTFYSAPVHVPSQTRGPPASLNRGGSDLPSFLCSRHSRAEESFLSLFFPLQTFFSSLSSSAVSFQRACCSLIPLPPPLLHPLNPSHAGPPASSLERFPESAQINECNLVCVHACVREGGRRNAVAHHKLRLCVLQYCTSLRVCSCARVFSAVVSKPNFILWIFFFWDHQSKWFRRELAFTLHVGPF